MRSDGGEAINRWFNGATITTLRVGEQPHLLSHPSEMFVLVVICIRAWLQWLNTYQFINITTAGVDTDS